MLLASLGRSHTAAIQNDGSDKSDIMLSCSHYEYLFVTVSLPYRCHDNGCHDDDGHSREREVSEARRYLQVYVLSAVREAITP